MPTVDIIIPAYNAARFLPAALDSVIAQSFTDWRILLIDDGSTDETAALISSYETRLGARLKYIYQENRGLAAARNVGVRHSSAALLALLDADDLWLPNRLALSVAAFEGEPHVGLSYGFVSRVDTEGVVLDTFAARKKQEEGRIAPLIYMRAVDLPCPTVTFRRRCVEEVGLFDETMRATEDRDLWLRIALHYEVKLVPEVIAYYRVSPEAMTTDPERMLKAQLLFLEKHYGSPGCGLGARRRALSGIYRQRAEALADRGAMKSALGSAARALRFRPLDPGVMKMTASLIMRVVKRRERVE